MALTWRNVDAPDLRGAMSGLAQSNQMLNDALSTASNTLGSIDADRSNQVNRQIQLNALKYQDPAAYQAALQSGQITAGADPTRISADTLAGLDTRAGTLLDRQASQYRQGRIEKTDASRDAAGPAMAAMNAAYATGDPAQIARVQEQYGPQLAQLSGADNAAQWQTAQGLESGGLGNDAKRFSNNNAVTDYNDNRTAQDLFMQVRRQSAEGTDALAAIEGMDITPGVRTKLTNMIQGVYGDLYAPGGAALPGAATGTGGTPSAFSGSIKFPETQKYVAGITAAAGNVSGTNAQKADQLLPHLFKTESNNTHRNADGTVVQGPVTKSGDRAQGVGQVMPKTAKDPGYGVKPAKDDSEAENRRVSRDYLIAMLDKYDGDTEKALAAYNAGPGNVDDWISSVDKDATMRATAQTSSRYMQNTGMGGASNRLEQNFGSNANASEIARELTGKDGVYSGGSAGRVADAITRVMQDANVNAAQAGDILAASPQEAGFWTDVGGFLGGRNQTRNLGGDLRINDTAVQAEIAAHNSGRSVDQMIGQKITGQQIQAQTQAQQTYDNARLAYQGALAQSEFRPKLKESLPRLRAALVKAEAALQDQLSTQRGSPDLQARRIGKPENQAVQQQQGGGTPSVAPAPGIAMTPRELLMR